MRLEGMLVHWPALKQTKKLSKGGAFYAQCRGHLVVHWLAAFLSDGKARPRGWGWSSSMRGSVGVVRGSLRRDL